MTKWSETFRSVGDALQLGFSIVIAIVMGAAIGYGLDHVFGTFPILSIVFFFFGIGAAFRNVWIVAKKELKRYEDK